jgi:hypothetical protein
MLRRFSCTLPAAALLTLACAVHAGPDPLDSPAARPNPLDAQAAVPPLAPPSAFAGYRFHSEPKLTPWREANETVGRIGGWRAYAREASQGAEPAPPAAPAAAPPRDGHTGHTGHTGHPMK